MHGLFDADTKMPAYPYPLALHSAIAHSACVDAFHPQSPLQLQCGRVGVPAEITVIMPDGVVGGAVIDVGGIVVGGALPV